MSGGRLNAVRETILMQIKEMNEKHPDRKVGIVTFTDYVDIIGDGSAPNLRLESSELMNYDNILK
jgi:hypothetical protein